MLQTIFFFVVSFFAVVQASKAKPPVDESDIAFRLDDMIAFLRNGDERLVRYNVPDQTSAYNQQVACSKDLKHAMELLTDHSHLPLDTPYKEVTNKSTFMQAAVRVAILCATDNPTLRQQIGKVRGVLDAIVDLLDHEKYGAEVSATAAEAIWILSFNNAQNHGVFVQNAIPSLVKIICNEYPKNDTTGDEQTKNMGTNGIASSTSLEHEADPIFIAKMWAFVALQNLAASYCQTQSGHCWWEYDTMNGLNLHQHSPLEIDGSKAAKAIVDTFLRELTTSTTTVHDSEDHRREVLIHYLRKIVCESRAKKGQEDSWASSAKLSAIDTATPGIMTWAAAGLMKNLALYKETESITHGTSACLCNLCQSPDWLESSKAQEALQRLDLMDTCEHGNAYSTEF